MAVHEPGTGVVGRVGNDEPTAGREHDDVAAWWVSESELRKMGAYVELAGTCSENVAVVAVKMDGVSDRGSVGRLLDDPVGPLSSVSPKSVSTSRGYLQQQ
jgi:hypothetical protein